MKNRLRDWQRRANNVIALFVALWVITRFLCRVIIFTASVITRMYALVAVIKAYALDANKCLQFYKREAANDFPEMVNFKWVNY